MKKFPKYTRAENNACKLLDKDIKRIRILRKKGHTIKQLAVKFKVSDSTIWYWCLSKKGRKEFIKYKLSKDTREKKYNKEVDRKRNKRKRKLKGKELREYYRDLLKDSPARKKWNKAYNKKKRKHLREYLRKWRAKRRKQGLPVK